MKQTITALRMKDEADGIAKESQKAEAVQRFMRAPDKASEEDGIKIFKDLDQHGDGFISTDLLRELLTSPSSDGTTFTDAEAQDIINAHHSGDQKVRHESLLAH